MEQKYVVLFVCTGNICRSPTAHAILRDMVASRGLEHLISVDSAGTSAYHVGEAADQRSMQAARRYGVEMRELRARQFARHDWHADLILVAGHEHLLALQGVMPAGWSGTLASILPGGDVPDPYYGGPAGFDEVFGLLREACGQWLQFIEKRIGRAASNGPAIPESGNDTAS